MGPSDGLGDDSYQPLSDVIGASSAGDGAAAEPIDPDHGDLFFPKPFNDEQVQIIRRLEKSDGLVVQGPPGTGKTHTIANIISHLLATGRRVLVVSHGETALSVIRDQLPEGVRDLTISVTTSEREGLKQVEKAIGLMLGIVNIVDGSHQRQRGLIRSLEATDNPPRRFNPSLPALLHGQRRSAAALIIALITLQFASLKMLSRHGTRNVSRLAPNVKQSHKLFE
jgi:hypothetical protein